MKKILSSTVIAAALAFGCAYAHSDTSNTEHKTSLKEDASHYYQVSKDATVKAAKSTGDAIADGYHKSKDWVSDKWDEHGPTVKKKTKHYYEVSKDATVKAAKKTGSAISSGYHKSKDWVEDKWDEHIDHKDQ